MTDLANGIRTGVNELSGGLAWLSSAITAATGECLNSNALEKVKERCTNTNILETVKERFANTPTPGTDGGSTRSTSLA